jgi:type III restriction enzyme
MLTLKNYQQLALDTLQDYFRECAQTDDADTAFYTTTRAAYGVGMPYRQVDELPGLPYVCIRIPTGGGKTLVASHAVGLAAHELLRADRCLVLWLVPSNAIRDQTLKALRDRWHPYRQVLEAAFGSVAVMDISEALYVSRPTLEAETAVIVSTLQAFRVEDTEGRKVYETAGTLASHFDGLPQEIARKLEQLEDGSVIPSLANVLRLHRPVVVMDEAHNARTPLSFKMLARFNPSCIIEFTATPDTEKSPSNVLHSVSAAQLQAEDMIKMPIRLETRSNWQEVLADAIAALSQLWQAARLERQETSEYLRPIMLIQAQPKHKDRETLTYEAVKHCLMTDHNIPEEQIAIATGSEWELDDVDLSSPDCPIRYIITVQALREGWDCPFAYVLCSVAELRSSTYVEQILGRIMRLPSARRKKNGLLNRAYAFVASPDFAEVASALVDGLVENGYNRQEATDLVTASPPISDLPLFARQMVTVTLDELPDLSKLPEELATHVRLDTATSTFTYTGVMSDNERKVLRECFATYAGQTAIERVYRQSQGWVVTETASPAERGQVFTVPMLACQQGALLEPFEATHFLETEWSLAGLDASLSESEFASQRSSGQQGEIVIEQGRVIHHFISDLQQQMTLIAGEQWNVGQLLKWLELNIPHPDLEPDDVAHFLRRIIRVLLDERGLPLDYLLHNKYRLRQAAELKMDDHRRHAHHEAFNALLLPDCPTPLVVTPDMCFSFDPNSYPYNLPYRGSQKFSKHYYKYVGSFDSQEELDCAVFIESLPEVKLWVRNPVKSPKAFSLQTSTDRFYPDFVCLLHDGRRLVVEYKSERDWSNDDSKEKRDLGELWEARSGGTCLFVMTRGKNLETIREKIARS